MDSPERPASRTAAGVALLRVVHDRCDGQPKILSDPVIPALLDDDLLRRAVASPEWWGSPRMAGLRSHVVLRSRFTEDCLREAAARGVRQYVILGAGFDTFAYRQPEWASALRIFEVDHPASQRAKIERLHAARIALPENLEFVAADFQVSSLLEILAASRLNFQAPAFFACLGVLVYLAAPAVEAIFRLVTSFPRGSEIVFTIAQPGEHSLAQDAAAVGEPWLSFHDPVLLASQLTAAGFSEVYFLDPETARERYYQDRTDALPPPRRVTIGRTVV